MKRQRQWGILLFVLWVLSTVNLSAQTFGDLKGVGAGRFETNCIHTLSSNCAITAIGQVAGTPVTAGDFIIRVDTGSPTSLNGNVHGNQGVCVPATGAAILSDPGGDSIEFSTVGTVCEEGEPSSPFHYRGTYRITGGTGRFATAKGTGNVATVNTREGIFTRGSGDSLFHLSGSISN